MGSKRSGETPSKVEGIRGMHITSGTNIMKILDREIRAFLALEDAVRDYLNPSTPRTALQNELAQEQLRYALADLDNCRDTPVE